MSFEFAKALGLDNCYVLSILCFPASNFIISQKLLLEKYYFWKN